MFNIVLYEPEIPANTGNIGRTCVVTGARLHLIEPLGFSLDERALHRAGLGYWENLDVSVYADWDEFLVRNGLADNRPADAENVTNEPIPNATPNTARLHLLTKKARRTYAEAAYQDGDFLVFGKESSGLPEPLLARYADRCERIPMLPDGASLANRAAWSRATDELAAAGYAPAGDATRNHAALRRQDICGNFIDVDDYRISALNLSNSVAIVLYEALRQTGFAGM